MSHSEFNERKAAQMAAYFALKEGAPIHVVKLAKLMYLSNRTFLDNFDMPMLFDDSYSMPRGPVLSTTLRYVNGEEKDSERWDEFVTDRSEHKLSAKTGVDENSFNEFSKADFSVLNEVWEKYGAYEAFALAELTHEICDEWDDPNGSAVSISLERILKSLKKENYKVIAAHINSLREIRSFG